MERIEKWKKENRKKILCQLYRRREQNILAERKAGISRQNITHHQENSEDQRNRAYSGLSDVQYIDSVDNLSATGSQCMKNHQNMKNFPLSRQLFPDSGTIQRLKQPKRVIIFHTKIII